MDIGRDIMPCLWMEINNGIVWLLQENVLAFEKDSERFWVFLLSEKTRTNDVDEIFTINGNS